MVRGPKDLTPREAVRRYIDGRRTELTEETASSYYYRLKLFVEWCERNAIDRVSELDGWLLDQYESHRSGVGVAPTTLNNEMDTLQSFVEYLERIEAVDDGLGERVNVPDVRREDRSRETKLDTERAVALIRHYRSTDVLRGTLRHALLETAWHTGARLGGLRSVDLRDFDRGDQTIEFVHRPESGTPLKNKREGERIVGLNEAVCETISTYIQNHRFDVHDDHGRQPLFTSREGRPNPNTVRVWMYRATFPCVRTECPHGHDPDGCDYRNHSKASQCPSSRAPHHVRTGSITWHRDRGVPREVTADRVNATQDVIDEYYDKATKRERMESRRRPHLDKLDIE
ncbi:tyrosine-type recombinase/integrase [Natrarchaeobaculum aegyptiacum]|uniref:Integrase n=1 Tax=Natrarchaeobaculum aegyptiacum TaxID=745377 RepID=A0A2Z2HRH5_9EURY|nr:tyrosine-type recombinase/integrase [Natrarchaeobaculum aegyptiacum]ARS89652.1 integrase [Natrarchaeobaculum aegyptiacum]